MHKLKKQFYGLTCLLIYFDTIILTIDITGCDATSYLSKKKWKAIKDENMDFSHNIKSRLEKKPARD